MKTQHLHTLFTVGYSGLAVRDLKDFAASRGALIVDVRLKPASRSPEWTFARLKTALGRTYVWPGGVLGNVNYRGGPVALKDAPTGVQMIVPLLAKRPVIVMCGCADYRYCHRTDAGRLIHAATGCQVIHLDAALRPVAEQLEVL